MADSDAKVSATYVRSPLEIGERAYCGDVPKWLTLQTFKSIRDHQLMFKADHLFYDFQNNLIPFTRHDVWESRAGDII